MSNPSNRAGAILKILALVCVEVALILFAFAPTNINSKEIRTLHQQYVEQPTDENRRTYESVAARVNRPFHVLQIGSAIIAILLPIGLGLRRRMMQHDVAESKQQS